MTPRLPRLFLCWSSCRLQNPRLSEMLNYYRGFASLSGALRGDASYVDTAALTCSVGHGTSG